MSGGTTGLGILGQALANMPVLVSTWEGGPPNDISFRLYKIPGRPPQTMLNISDSIAQTLLNQRNGSTHVKTGPTHMRRRISTATRDITTFLLFCSVLRQDEALVEEPCTDL